MTAIATCSYCGDILKEGNRTMKSISKKGKIYYLSHCKPCITEQSVILRELRKKHPQPAAGTPCACCGRIDKLFLDHDYPTKSFRGYCCRNCNSGIGQLGDSKQGLQKALAYLERAEARSRSPIKNQSTNKNNNSIDSNHDAN